MENIERKLIAIVGPTASGKTGWGVEVAKKFGGEIISADSRQVYRFLDIGTGKEGVPKNETKELKNLRTKEQCSNETMKQLQQSIRYIDSVPQWLIDIVEPGEKFTMFDWLAAARKVVEDIFARGKIPIIVGGTGLYVQALVEGFALETKELKNLRTEEHFSRKELEKKSLEELQEIYQKLATGHWLLATGYWQLDTKNPHRLIRAIERAQAGEVVTKKKPNFAALQIAIDLPREVLYQRIDQRVEEWFEQGFVKEVQGLLNSGVDPKWLEKIGLEYRILTRYILESLKSKIQMSNEIQNPNVKFGEMKQRMKFAIHSYARRQLTWFRRFPEVKWCRDLKSAEREIRRFLR